MRTLPVVGEGDGALDEDADDNIMVVVVAMAIIIF